MDSPASAASLDPSASVLRLPSLSTAVSLHLGKISPKGRRSSWTTAVAFLDLKCAVDAVPDIGRKSGMSISAALSALVDGMPFE